MNNKWTTKAMDDGWVHPLAKTLPSLLNYLWWNIVMGDWNVDEILLGKWQLLRHCKSVIPPRNLQGTTNNLGLAFSVGDAIPRFRISIEQDN